MRAAQDEKRSHVRDVKGLNEKVWEEALPPARRRRRARRQGPRGCRRRLRQVHEERLRVAAD